MQSKNTIMHFIQANANQELHDVASDNLKNKADLNEYAIIAINGERVGRLFQHLAKSHATFGIHKNLT